MKQKQKSIQGMKSKERNQGDGMKDEDHDAEWYKKEVGADPDKGLPTSHSFVLEFLLSGILV